MTVGIRKAWMPDSAVARYSHDAVARYSHDAVARYSHDVRHDEVGGLALGGFGEGDADEEGLALADDAQGDGGGAGFFGGIDGGGGLVR